MPITIYRGDSLRYAWDLLDGNDNPLNLTGASVRLHIRDASDTLLIEATAANELLTVTPQIGRIQLEIPYALVEEKLAVGKYSYDLEVTHADGTRITYDKDAIKILKDVTYGN